MNRATRNRFASATIPGSPNSCWETAPEVFRKLNDDFGPFDLDLTADPTRHLCPVWFGPGSPVGVFDALDATWCEHGMNGFSNPMYGRFAQRILLRARVEASVGGMTSLLLLPMRVTEAFLENVLHGASDLIFCDHRLVFFENGAPRVNKKAWEEKGRLVADAAMFDSILVRFTPERRHRPRVSEWHVPEHVTKDDLERARARMAPAA